MAIHFDPKQDKVKKKGNLEQVDDELRKLQIKQQVEAQITNQRAKRNIASDKFNVLKVVAQGVNPDSMLKNENNILKTGKISTAEDFEKINKLTTSIFRMLQSK
ncbi:MAG: hypothetical protein LBE20_03750 [Deltaproteobacteria bacterium]|jgi:hypothetical protein|nr:hypothetical protein [Deltaproteobacteria bacterium]